MQIGTELINENAFDGECEGMGHGGARAAAAVAARAAGERRAAQAHARAHITPL